MINLRDVTKDDKEIYLLWQNNSDLTAYLSRLSPHNSSIDTYDSSKICWLIVEYNGLEIGSIWLEKNGDGPNKMVLGIFIAEDKLRGHGIGSKIIKEAIKISTQRIHFDTVTLNVRKNNIRAIQCYEKCDFRITGDGQKINSKGAVIDYYRMELKLGCEHV